jgi:hypothetical protein
MKVSFRLTFIVVIYKDMKKKKKRIKTFKNWLLARDSSSRINHLAPDHQFFGESEKSGKKTKKKCE